MNVGELIRYYRKKNNMSQEVLGEKLGMSKAYISQVENETKVISFQQLLKFANTLNIPASEIDRIRKEINAKDKTEDSEFDELLQAKENLERFLHDRGLTVPQSDVAMIPVVGKVPAGAPLVTYEDAIDLAESHFPVPSSAVTHTRCFFLKVFGDSMIDIGIREGDLVLIDPEDREVSGIGRVMAIEVDGEVTLKTVVRLNNHKLRLIPENSRYAPFEVDMKKQTVRVIGSSLPFMARWNPEL